LTSLEAGRFFLPIMFKIEKLKPKYANLLGWRQHFSTDVQLSPGLLVTESGEYYQDKHPALRLDYIQTILSKAQSIDDYLKEKVEAATTSIFYDLIQHRQLNNYGKTLLEQAQLLNKHSWLSDKIVNQNRFVGLQIKLKDSTGLQVLLNEIGLQLDGPQQITLYLFHSQKELPLKEIILTTTDTGVQWSVEELELDSWDRELFYGGVFILGYYQEDLTTQAVNYTNFNWDKGECASCNNSYYEVWKSIKNHFFIYPLYVPQGSFEKGKMFDLKKAFYVNDCSFGLNLRLTVRCDLTNFFIQNKVFFKNLLGLKVAHLVLNDMKFSQETNYIQEDLKNMVIRDLEGDKETNALNINQLYKAELKAVSFNMTDINNRCLNSSTENYQPDYGVV